MDTPKCVHMGENPSPSHGKKGPCIEYRFVCTRTSRENMANKMNDVHLPSMQQITVEVEKQVQSSDYCGSGKAS